MRKSAKPTGTGAKKGDAAVLRKSLLSIGVDEKSADKLLSSRALERLVVPVYWKDGLVSHAHPLRLSKLPSFLRSFEKEFPDGQVRWGPGLRREEPAGRLEQRGDPRLSSTTKRTTRETTGRQGPRRSRSRATRGC